MSLADKLQPTVPRVLTVDIETSPAVARVWGLWDQNIPINHIVERSRVLCVAGKWLDSKRVMFASEFHDGYPDFLRVVWEWFDEADVVVTYNGVKFDVPHLQREWLLAGWGPPSPWIDVDLLKVNRSRFKFLSNKLGYVTDVLGLDSKLSTAGQDLWNRVLDGDEAAWKRFKKYNETDVIITEQLFRVLAPWIRGPHMGLIMGDPMSCYSCGSRDLSPAGFVFTKTTKYPKMVCVCGAWNKIMRSGETRPA